MNPYRVLGVRKNASQEQIKKAYRGKSMKCHPDRGGDRELFNQVQLAYAVLSDPDRRQHYDTTGEIKEVRSASLAQSMIVERLVLLYKHTLYKHIEANRNLTTVDFIAAMKNSILRNKKGTEDNLQKGLAILKSMESVKGRFKCKPNTTNTLHEVFEAFTEAEIDATNQAVNKLKDQIKVYDEDLDALDDIEYTYTQAGGAAAAYTMTALRDIATKSFVFKEDVE